MKYTPLVIEKSTSSSGAHAQSVARHLDIAPVNSLRNLTLATVKMYYSPVGVRVHGGKFIVRKHVVGNNVVPF